MYGLPQSREDGPLRKRSQDNTNCYCAGTDNSTEKPSQNEATEAHIGPADAFFTNCLQPPTERWNRLAMPVLSRPDADAPDAGPVSIQVTTTTLGSLEPPRPSRMKHADPFLV